MRVHATLRLSFILFSLFMTGQPSLYAASDLTVDGNVIANTGIFSGVSATTASISNRVSIATSSTASQLNVGSNFGIDNATLKTYGSGNAAKLVFNPADATVGYPVVNFGSSGWGKNPYFTLFGGAAGQSLALAADGSNNFLSSLGAPLRIQSGTNQNIFLLPSGTGKVGIGTTSSVNMLDVAGSMAIGAFAGVNTAPSNGLIVSGSVGIGNATPTATDKLTVSGGDTHLDGKLTATGNLIATTGVNDTAVIGYSSAPSQSSSGINNYLTVYGSGRPATAVVRIDNDGLPLEFTRIYRKTWQIGMTAYNGGGLVFRNATDNLTNLMITEGNNVSIGCMNPQTKLDVDGVICLRGQSSPSLPSSTTNGYIFTNVSDNFATSSSNTHGTGRGLYGAFGSTVTRLSSHADPRDVDPNATTSFADKAIEMPFSFSHVDTLIGKGQIVDTAKMVSYIEKKMQAELGDKAGRLVFTYDLPTSMRMTRELYTQKAMEGQVAEILAKMDDMPWIKVKIGSDGRIPDEAFEEVPVYTTMKKKVNKSVKAIDTETKRLVVVSREEEVVEKIPTGKTKRQLRQDWMFNGEDLYRKPTTADINIDELVTRTPKIPAWILDRLKTGQATAMDIKALTDQIRQILAAQAVTVHDRQAAQLSN